MPSWDAHQDYASRNTTFGHFQGLLFSSLWINYRSCGLSCIMYRALYGRRAALGTKIAKSSNTTELWTYVTYIDSNRSKRARICVIICMIINNVTLRIVIIVCLFACFLFAIRYLLFASLFCSYISCTIPSQSEIKPEGHRDKPGG